MCTHYKQHWLYTHLYLQILQLLFLTCSYLSTHTTHTHSSSHLALPTLSHNIHPHTHLCSYPSSPTLTQHTHTHTHPLTQPLQLSPDTQHTLILWPSLTISYPTPNRHTYPPTQPHQLSYNTQHKHLSSHPALPTLIPTPNTHIYSYTQPYQLSPNTQHTPTLTEQHAVALSTGVRLLSSVSNTFIFSTRQHRAVSVASPTFSYTHLLCVGMNFMCQEKRMKWWENVMSQ